MDRYLPASQRISVQWCRVTSAGERGRKFIAGLRVPGLRGVPHVPAAAAAAAACEARALRVRLLRGLVREPADADAGVLQRLRGIPSARRAVRGVVRGLAGRRLPGVLQRLRGLDSARRAVRGVVRGLAGRRLPGVLQRLRGLDARRRPHVRGLVRMHGAGPHRRLPHQAVPWVQQRVVRLRRDLPLRGSTRRESFDAARAAACSVQAPQPSIFPPTPRRASMRAAVRQSAGPRAFDLPAP